MRADPPRPLSEVAVGTQELELVDPLADVGDVEIVSAELASVFGSVVVDMVELEELEGCLFAASADIPKLGQESEAASLGLGSALGSPFWRSLALFRERGFTELAVVAQSIVACPVLVELVGLLDLPTSGAVLQLKSALQVRGPTWPSASRRFFF